MTDTTSQPLPSQRKSIVQQLELDTRLLGMIGAFILLCLAFNFFTDGRFLTPRNIFNLTIQTVSVAIMACGMVFIIVTRHIDLSVGALLATCSAVMAMLQTRWLVAGIDIDWTILGWHLAIQVEGLPLGHWALPWLAIIGGLCVGGLIGAFQGYLVGYLTIPAFIVTLGGLLVWRNVGWFMTRGQTIGPLDDTFMAFGGINGTLGPTLSWIVGAVLTAAAIAAMWSGRGSKASHGFPVKPIWAELTLSAITAAAILGFIWVLNSYQIPAARLRRMFEARGEVMPEGFTDTYGLPISVLLLIGIAIAMTILAKRTRLGRYIFATGGNPDAAELSGINTRLLTVKIFALMGGLCAISAVVASARLANHTNDIGTLDELRVIAAAVIGGTALSGGLGTIHGAILGALIMQSLQSGMAMVGVDAPYQNIVVGVVLVVAVLIDIIYRKRTGDH